MSITYADSDWRLFIDSSNKSINAVLLNNGNRVFSIPVDYSISMSENYKNMIVLVDSLNYNNHNGIIFGDMKVIYYNIYYNNYNYLKCFIILIYTFVDCRYTLCMKSEYIKYPCFLYKWDGRADREHYSRRIWS